MRFIIHEKFLVFSLYKKREAEEVFFLLFHCLKLFLWSWTWGLIVLNFEKVSEREIWEWLEKELREISQLFAKTLFLWLEIFQNNISFFYIKQIKKP